MAEVEEIKEETLGVNPPVDLIEFGQAKDGTTLHWAVKEPDRDQFAPPWYCVLAVHGGGFTGGTPGTPIGVAGPDLAAAGFIAFSPEYRLAPPGKIAGQTSLGRYPDQTDDLAVAIDAATKDDRVKGNPQMVGGSGGAYQTAFWAAKGVLTGVALSPCSQLDDAIDRRNFPTFAAKCDNYAAGQLREASPNTYVNEASRPLLVVAYSSDQMPPRQYSRLVEALAAFNIEHGAILLRGKGHSWDAWVKVKAQAIAFLQEHKA
jgi:acetyl esterase/lipase